MNRASWSVVELEPNSSRPVSWIAGVVPRDYPQTAQASEYLAGMYANMIRKPCATLYDDCANVVAAMNADKGS